MNVFKYEPDYSYTDQPLEDPDPFERGMDIAMYRHALDRYLKIERARRNPMLNATNTMGELLYRLTESGNLARRFPIPRSTLRLVLERDEVCVWCGAVGPLDVDHIERYVDGGGNDPSNLRALCRPCHTSRGGRA